MFGSLALFALSGCSELDCGHVIRASDRDWCFAQEAVDLARAGNTSESARSLARVSGPMVKASAIQGMIGLRVPGMDRDTARGLCEGLDTTWRENCLALWDRPEVWGDAG